MHEPTRIMPMSESMMDLRPTIDLDQLAARESEQIEWKENVADVSDVARTLSAFANDLANLGGGLCRLWSCRTERRVRVPVPYSDWANG